MNLALEQARNAMNQDEVPVGCIIVNNNTKEIVSKSYNLVESYNVSIFHAEMLAIYFASRKLKQKYLTECSMYVTLEPCIMCSQAISKARLKNLYFAALEPKQGSIESNIGYFNTDYCLYKPNIYSGIKEEEASILLKDFFSRLRKSKKTK
ncbi:nucleoside deaminase [Rickettsia endosymbiont of Cardiosporidium cionae]|nr:nucleoside deaminase [Rickettsia endosymbiont of Cardiosporidium cionae]